MTEELKRFEKWWDAGDDIPNDGPYTPDTPIQFAWAGWQAALAQPEQEPVAWMTINGYGEEDDIHYENPEGRLMEGWTYKPLYTQPPQPAPMAQPELNAAIVQTLLPKLYSIIDRLLDGQDKALVIEARRVLPKAYKNSFEKGKGV
jgi:hypothetical protein